MALTRTGTAARMSVVALAVVLAYPVPAIAATTSLVSCSATGAPGRFSTIQPQISADGRYVAMLSYADDLIAGDTNCASDIYVKDLATALVARGTLAVNGQQPNASCFHPCLSSNGEFLVYSSDATNMFGTMDANNRSDVYHREFEYASTNRASWAPASKDPDGNSTAGAVSDDGRFVTFASFATNLINDDTNGTGDVFVRDMQFNKTGLVSVAYDGGMANGWSHSPGASADGRFVVFVSLATNIVNDGGEDGVFVRDRLAGTTQRVDVNNEGQPLNGSAFGPRISSDGSAVVFYSTADNLGAQDTNCDYDIFVRDLVAKTTSCASVSTAGSIGNGQSTDPNVSATGRYVVFTSTALNLVVGGTSLYRNVFMRDRLTNTTKRVSLNADGSAMAGGGYGVASVDASGTRVAFTTWVDSGGAYGDEQIMLRDLAAPGAVPQFVQASMAQTSVVLPSYGASLTISGALFTGEGALASQTVRLESSADGIGFSPTLMTGETNASGQFSLVVRPMCTTTYRVVPEPAGPWNTSGLSAVRVVPVPSVGTPNAPKAMSKSKYYTVYGYLKPHHAARTYPARIYKWKKTSSGRWKSYGYVKAKASDYKSYTKYSRPLRLSSAGKWRLRAHAPADSGHTASWSSGYDYVTVK